MNSADTEYLGDLSKPEEASFTYDGISDHTKALECNKNLYDKVLDFKWHKQDHSPNWTEMEAPEFGVKLPS